jgi:hypothetical protein
MGHFFIAIDREYFISLIYTAGEKEYNSEKIVNENGVPVNKSIQKDLITMRNELNLLRYHFPFE